MEPKQRQLNIELGEKESEGIYSNLALISHSPQEIILDFAISKGIEVAVADVWSKGGKGALSLAKKVIKVIEENKSNFKPLYDWDMDVKTKIEIIATKIYGAEHVDYTSKAKQDLAKIKILGLENLPVCIAKTQKSLSDNPKLLGRPKDFIITVR